jgi:acetylornithine/succinyldiaminopimelate/putrescine aminotransferase
MPAMFALYREPVMITEGKMQYLFDERGRRYLDVRHTGAERFCQLCL